MCFTEDRHLDGHIVELLMAECGLATLLQLAVLGQR